MAEDADTEASDADSTDDDFDPVAVGVELLSKLEHAELTVAEAVDRMREALAIEDDGDAHARLAVWLMYLGDRPAARAAIADADRLGGRVPATVRARLDEDADGTG